MVSAFMNQIWRSRRVAEIGEAEYLQHLSATMFEGFSCFISIFCKHT